MVQPDEVYNLGAQSHVQVSFETPEYTANTDALGTLRLLEAIRILDLENKSCFYLSRMQALGWTAKYDHDAGIAATYVAYQP